MKQLEEIFEEMCRVFRERTGREVGQTGELAVRLWAAAAQIHALYVQNDWLERQCFPQTATGRWLDRHAQMRGLERRGPVAAVGRIRFSLDRPAETPLSVPAGTVCLTAGLVRFITTEEGTIRAGETFCETAARAVEPGTGGNAGSGTINAMAVAPVGVSRCGNPAPFTGGRDPEGDEDLRVRVLDTFRRMPNGANAAFYEQEALSFPEVAAATVLPRKRGVGTVDVVVAAADGLPGKELLEALNRHLEERREIAVDVAVRAPTVKSVGVSVEVAPAEGTSAEEAQRAARSRVEGWFDGHRLGRPVLRAELEGLVFGTPGVGNCRVTAPAQDVAVAPDELPRLGKLTVGALV